MEYLMFSIYDTVSERFLNPMYYENKEAAKRGFAHIINKNDTMKENPEQFQLMELALFDEVTGAITVENKDGGTVGEPQLICKGSDLVRKE